MTPRGALIALPGVISEDSTGKSTCIADQIDGRRAVPGAVGANLDAVSREP
ncbi:hypothetical protein QA601_11255 [Chitinispirillales bacterium ANBcel5]|uniref:hypothetical protein n=1 Tax=Cellulosispirillum alkaliphilum TaxID=3039283 RepID=UPI002A549A0E|nr:hypothetical protein [Chitinispirillales bacterium ANBcel5]